MSMQKHTEHRLYPVTLYEVSTWQVGGWGVSRLGETSVYTSAAQAHREHHILFRHPERNLDGTTYRLLEEKHCYRRENGSYCYLEDIKLANDQSAE